MTTALDVATYLQTQAHASRVGLQKLPYYARAWCLVELDEDCFPEPMQAWRMGPVAPAVYEAGAHLEGSPEYIPEHIPHGNAPSWRTSLPYTGH